MGINAKMLVRTTATLTQEEVRRLSYHLASSLGADNFWIDREEHGALAIVPEWDQDGPTLYPKRGETFIRVYLTTRYYGPGYERGDLLIICAVAEWCEQNIPNAEVWYGGDSSGVCVEPFSAEERTKLRQHLYMPDKGREYYNEYRSVGNLPGDDIPLPDISACKLCISNHRPQRYGYGSTFAAYLCRGCGTRFVTHDAGKTWTDKDN